MKVQRIDHSTLEINFQSPREEFSQYWQSFLMSEVGQIHLAVPWAELVKHLKLKENKKGPSRLFSPKGMVALMFLKSYLSCSDRKLIEHLNGNINFQLFCDIFLGGKRLTNFKIVSQVRTFLSSRLDIKESQVLLAKAWKPYLDHPTVMLSDATCYETSMRYPTNVKLLWESVDWCHGQLKQNCKYLKIQRPRTKYLKQKERYSNYSRKRRKSKKERRVLTRSLLHLLNKLLGLLEGLEEEYANKLELPLKYYRQLVTIHKVLEQQQEIFVTGESVPDRIVSLSKSYIRPIVRGKETKMVEFGAKVNTIQFDGINFIEHLDFKAFHEGVRLIKSVRYGRELMGDVTHLSADAIYATNLNRSYCKLQSIVHGFKRKGRAGKHEEGLKILRSILQKERATRMEGSFGTEKEYYGLKRIKARTEDNERLWIFFGVHTANAIRIAKKMALSKERAA
jgi:hypothetical protein